MLSRRKRPDSAKKKASGPMPETQKRKKTQKRRLKRKMRQRTAAML